MKFQVSNDYFLIYCGECNGVRFIKSTIALKETSYCPICQKETEIEVIDIGDYIKS